MTDTTDNTAAAATFFDMREVHEAMADPLYKTSARFRDEVAVKLVRSQAAGTVGRITDRITSEARSHTTYAATAEEGIYGDARPMPRPAAPVLNEVLTFKSVADITAAMNADSYRDPSYRRGVTERIHRSIREGTLDEQALTQVAIWTAEAEAAVDR